MDDKYVIIKYMRLSKEDGDKEESNSISNQRDMLNYYIDENIQKNIHMDIEDMEIVDDGYSGTNMNRPGIKKLLNLAKSQLVNCIIIKDFSRFARDYIEVGKYIDKIFPEYGIRFISVNDNYDSSNYIGMTSGIDSVLKSILYTMYSMDLSNKISSSIRILNKQGIYTSPYAIYGYKKDPNNKGKLLIDDDAAEVVRRIYGMRLKGDTIRTIAKRLNKENILPPSKYKEAIYPLCRKWNNINCDMVWTPSKVYRILRDIRYTGKYKNGNYKKEFGRNELIRKKPEEIIIVENAQEAIISYDVYKKVNNKFNNREYKKTEKSNIKMPSIFRGVIRCGGCHHIMSIKGGKNAYFCDYSELTEYNDCYKGVIEENKLIQLLKNEIKIMPQNDKLENRKENIENKINDILKEVTKLTDKVELQKKIRTSNYINLTKGEITDAEFNNKRAEINENILNLNVQIEELLKEKAEVLVEKNVLEDLKDDTKIGKEIVDKFIKNIYVYSDGRIEIEWKIQNL